MAPPLQTSPADIMGLSPTALLVLLFFSVASTVYYFLIPRFWPGSIISSTSERRAKALLRFANIQIITSSKDLRALYEKIAPDSTLADKISKLQTRYNQWAWDDGVLALIKEFRTLYNEACVLEADMDSIEIMLDKLLPPSSDS